MEVKRWVIFKKVNMVSNMKFLRDVYTARRLEKESLCLAIKR